MEGRTMPRDDEEYYRGRALQEQVAAQNAASETARSRHQELAVIYRFRAAMASRGPGKWNDYRCEEPDEAAAGEVP